MFDDNDNYDHHSTQSKLVIKSLQELVDRYDDEFDQCCQCDDKSPSRCSQWTSYFPFLACFCTSNLVFLITATTLNRRHGEHKSYKLLNDTMASLVSVILTTPLWVTNSRLRRGARRRGVKCTCGKHASDQSLLKTYLKQLVEIGKHEGMEGLYGGLRTSILLTLLSSPLNTLAMDLMRRKLSGDDGRRKVDQINANRLVSMMSMSIVSRCLVTALTYPLHLIQSQQRHSSPANRPSLSSALKDIFHQQGALGLYQGIEAKLVQTSLLAGLVAITQPRLVIHLVERVLGNRSNKSNKPGSSIF